MVKETDSALSTIGAIRTKTPTSGIRSATMAMPASASALGTRSTASMMKVNTPIDSDVIACPRM